MANLLEKRFAIGVILKIIYMSELISRIESLNAIYNRLNVKLQPCDIFQLYSPMSVQLRESLSIIIDKIGDISFTGEYVIVYTVNDDDPTDIHVYKGTGTIYIPKCAKHIMKCDGTVITPLDI